MKLLAIAFVVISSVAFAGGSTGGSPGLVLEDTVSAAFSVDSLPKIYVHPDDFRRANARLSVGNVASAPVLFNGESIQVKRWLDSVVDVKMSNEVLPDPAK